MASKIFKALELRITELGNANDGVVDFSELSLIGKGDKKVIAFSLIGAAFLLTPENEIISVDGKEGSAKTFAVAGDMKQSILRFLVWRYGFINEYGI